MTSLTMATSDDMVALGKALAFHLEAGSVLCLQGEMGVGKTTLVRGLVEGLDGDLSSVSSPTFAVMQCYQGLIPIWHIDLFRVPAPVNEDVFAELGLEVFPDSQAVTLIEWPERLEADLCPSAEQICLSFGPESSRQVSGSLVEKHLKFKA